MLRGKYIGPVAEWKGETALLMAGHDTPEGFVLVQFDNLNKVITKDGAHLQFGWTRFAVSDWSIQPLDTDSEVADLADGQSAPAIPPGRGEGKLGGAHPVKVSSDGCCGIWPGCVDPEGNYCRMRKST